MSSTAAEQLPLIWPELVGHQKASEQIGRLVHEQRLPQVMLFSGRSGIGKSLFVAKLVGFLVCQQGQACGQCSSCRELMANLHPEVLWIGGDDRLKIEHGKKIQSHLSVMASHSFSGDMAPCPRVVVVSDIDRATDQLANQLLKTLEEPPSNTFIFLSSSKPKQILPTILSRVVNWHLEPPSLEQSLSYLRQKYAGEYKDDYLTEALRRSGYSLGKALDSLSQADIQEEAQIDELLIQMMFNKSFSQSMEAASRITKDLKLANEALIVRIELLLNQYYKWHLGILSDTEARHFPKTKTPLSMNSLKAWRSKLTEFREFAVHKKVPLNSQLLAETFILTR